MAFIKKKKKTTFDGNQIVEDEVVEDKVIDGDSNSMEVLNAIDGTTNQHPTEAIDKNETKQADVINVIDVQTNDEKKGDEHFDDTIKDEENFDDTKFFDLVNSDRKKCENYLENFKKQYPNVDLQKLIVDNKDYYNQRLQYWKNYYEQKRAEFRALDSQAKNEIQKMVKDSNKFEESASLTKKVVNNTAQLSTVQPISNQQKVDFKNNLQKQVNKILIKELKNGLYSAVKEYGEEKRKYGDNSAYYKYSAELYNVFSEYANTFDDLLNNKLQLSKRVINNKNKNIVADFKSKEIGLDSCSDAFLKYMLVNYLPKMSNYFTNRILEQNKQHNYKNMSLSDVKEAINDMLSTSKNEWLKEESGFVDFSKNSTMKKTDKKNFNIQSKMLIKDLDKNCIGYLFDKLLFTEAYGFISAKEKGTLKNYRIDAEIYNMQVNDLIKTIDKNSKDYKCVCNSPNKAEAIKVVDEPKAKVEETEVEQSIVDESVDMSNFDYIKKNLETFKQMFEYLDKENQSSNYYNGEYKTALLDIDYIKNKNTKKEITSLQYIEDICAGNPFVKQQMKNYKLKLNFEEEKFNKDEKSL